MKHDEFGNRMKGYEKELAFNINHKLVKIDLGLFDGVEMIERGEDTLYPYMRLDGRSFSNFTKKLARRGMIQKPRDVSFEDVFVRTCKDIVAEFNLKLAFHQSDEISIFFSPVIDSESQMLFNGNIQKLTSVVPSYFTSRFCYHFHEQYNEVPELSFDGRVCVFTDDVEATNMLVWRFQDARRNLIQDIAHHQFGDKVLFKKSTNEKFEMIGSPELKPGNFIKRTKYELYGFGDIPENDHTVIRSQSSVMPIDFQSMTFDEKRSLIYGDFLVKDKNNFTLIQD